MNGIKSAKDLFLGRMRKSLKGMPRAAIEETIDEYSAHFDAGIAAGRSKEDIAHALGDPARLAREIRAEDGVRRWENDRTLYAATRAVFSMIGLLAVDVLLVLPLLFSFGVLLFVMIVVGFAFTLAGAVVAPLCALGLGHMVDMDGLQGILIGVGLLGAGVALCSLCLLLAIIAVNMLVRYGRAHYRTIVPSDL